MPTRNSLCPVVTEVCNIKSLPRGWQTLPDYANHVYIGRKMPGLLPPFLFGNPFKPGDKIEEHGIARATLADCLRLYEGHLHEQLRDVAFRLQVQALHGKTLVCWCAAYKEQKGTPCHGDILAGCADELETLAIANRHALLRLRDWEVERRARLLPEAEAEATIRHHVESLRHLKPPMPDPAAVRTHVNPVFQTDLTVHADRYTHAQRHRLR